MRRRQCPGPLARVYINEVTLLVIKNIRCVFFRFIFETETCFKRMFKLLYKENDATTEKHLFFATIGRSWAALGRLGPPLATLGPLLGALERLFAALGRSWSVLGLSWVALGCT